MSDKNPNPIIIILNFDGIDRETFSGAFHEAKRTLTTEMQPSDNWKTRQLIYAEAGIGVYTTLTGIDYPIMEREGFLDEFLRAITESLGDKADYLEATYHVLTKFDLLENWYALATNPNFSDKREYLIGKFKESLVLISQRLEEFISSMLPNAVRVDWDHQRLQELRVEDVLPDLNELFTITNLQLDPERLRQIVYDFYEKSGFLKHADESVGHEETQ